MANVVVDLTMSLDGFVAGPNPTLGGTTFTFVTKGSGPR
jgi:hypothetical protein